MAGIHIKVGKVTKVGEEDVAGIHIIEYFRSKYRYTVVQRTMA